MNKKFIVLISVVLLVGTMMLGCGSKTASSSEAIELAQAKATVQEKVSYLASQANAFLNSKQYEEAVKTAQYILSNLDANSQDAKSIIEKAKVEMQKMAQSAVNDVKNKLGSFGQ